MQSFSSEVKRKAIQAQLAGRKNKDIAEGLELNNSTISLWRKHDPEYRQIYREEVGEVFGNLEDRLPNDIVETYDNMMAIVRDPSHAKHFEALKFILEKFYLGIKDSGLDVSATVQDVKVGIDEAKFNQVFGIV